MIIKPPKIVVIGAGSAIFGAASASDPNRYDTVIGEMRNQLAKS